MTPTDRGNPELRALLAELEAARALPCRKCGARAGEPCSTAKGYRAATHAARRRAARELERGADA